MVTPAQTRIAAKWLTNVEHAATAADATGCPFWLLCAVLEKESKGRNIYGHDRGGVFTYPDGRNVEVTAANFAEFIRRVRAGETSNGVGPMQITWPPFFDQMEKANLRPWVPADNIRFGASILAGFYTASRGSTDERVRQVGVRYNGGSAYGDDLARVARTWRTRLAADAFTGATVTHIGDLPLTTAYRTPGSDRARALWQGATYAVDPRDGVQYLFQIQAQPYRADIEHAWIHRYQVTGNPDTGPLTTVYVDSMRCLKFGHLQTLHVRISRLGNVRVWVGVETYDKRGKKTGTKVWRVLYRKGDVLLVRIPR